MHSTSSGLKAMMHAGASQKQTIKPLLAAAQDLRASRGAAESQNPR
jgi:hypothetical protein